MVGGDVQEDGSGEVEVVRVEGGDEAAVAEGHEVGGLRCVGVGHQGDDGAEDLEFGEGGLLVAPAAR
jgi:hypothetical protein